MLLRSCAVVRTSVLRFVASCISDGLCFDVSNDVQQVSFPPSIQTLGHSTPLILFFVSALQQQCPSKVPHLFLTTMDFHGEHLRRSRRIPERQELVAGKQNPNEGNAANGIGRHVQDGFSILLQAARKLAEVFAMHQQEDEPSSLTHAVQVRPVRHACT